MTLNPSPWRCVLLRHHRRVIYGTLPRTFTAWRYCRRCNLLIRKVGVPAVSAP